MIDVIFALAVWRVSYLLVHEGGPFGLLSKMRNRIGVRYDERNNAVGLNTLATLFTCVYCMSVWVGLAFALAREWSPLALVYALGYSGAAIAIHTFVSKGK